MFDNSKIKIGSEITFQNWSGEKRTGRVTRFIDGGSYEVQTKFATVMVDPDEIVGVEKYADGGTIDVSQIKVGSEIVFVAGMSDAQREGVVASIVSPGMYEVSSGFGKVLVDSDEIVSVKKYGYGGSIEEQNYEMVKNNNKAIAHHSKELDSVLVKNKKVPAWVVAKVYEASNDLSDVTHYLDGAKFEYGGKLSEYGGTQYLSWDFDNKGNKWNVLVAWGRNNYISVLKKTNNPYGGRMGTEFKSVDEALAKYKDPTIQANILFAIKEAEKHGKPKQWKQGGYVRPSSSLKTTGIYEFRTNYGLVYEFSVVGFERKGDDTDSLYFDDLDTTAKKELGSITIKNNAWNRLSKGQTITAESAKGTKGKLTRLRNLYAEGGITNDLKVVKVGNLYKIKSASYTEKTGNNYYQKISKNNKYIDLTFATKKEAQDFASKKPTFGEGGNVDSVNWIKNGDDYLHPSGYSVVLEIKKGDEDWSGETYDEDMYIITDPNGTDAAGSYMPLDEAKQTLVNILAMDDDDEFKKGGSVGQDKYTVVINYFQSKPYKFWRKFYKDIGANSEKEAKEIALTEWKKIKASANKEIQSVEAINMTELMERGKFAEGGYIKGDEINPNEYVLINATSDVGDITYVVKKSELEKIPELKTLEQQAKAFIDVIDDRDDKYFNVYFKELIEDSEQVKEYVSGYNHSAYYINPIKNWDEDIKSTAESSAGYYGFTISNKPKMAQGGGVQYKDLSQQKDMVINESKNKFSEKKNDIPEVEMVFKKAKDFETYPVIDSSERAIEVFRKFWDQERIPIQESFYVMFLNTANKPISIYNPFKGGISSTVADVEIITAAAIKSLARGVIICHNHPSGNLKFSQADIALTRKLANALKTVDITILDSMVITENSYTSMADERIDFTPTV